MSKLTNVETEHAELTVCQKCWDAVWEANYGHIGEIDSVDARINEVIYDVVGGGAIHRPNSETVCELCFDSLKGSWFTLSAHVYCF